MLSGTLAAFKSWAVNNPESAEDAARKLGLRPDLLACWGACAAVRQVWDPACTRHEACAARDWPGRAAGDRHIHATWVMTTRLS